MTGVILHCVWPRCLIVDDSASFRYASRMLLERQGLTVVGVATTLDECVSFVEQFEPDVILLDVELGAESGFDLGGRLGTGRTPSNVIFMSSGAAEDYADLAADSGALGFLPKSDVSKEAIVRLLANPARPAHRGLSGTPGTQPPPAPAGDRRGSRGSGAC
jgi:DNA-binding NarL/FixJ family response regulator